MREIHIAPDGHDGGSGSAQTPLATLKAACAKAVSGDCIRVPAHMTLAGFYRASWTPGLTIVCDDGYATVKGLFSLNLEGKAPTLDLCFEGIVFDGGLKFRYASGVHVTRGVIANSATQGLHLVAVKDAALAGVAFTDNGTSDKSHHVYLQANSHAAFARCAFGGRVIGNAVYVAGARCAIDDSTFTAHSTGRREGVYVHRRSGVPSTCTVRRTTFAGYGAAARLVTDAELDVADSVFAGCDVGIYANGLTAGAVLRERGNAYVNTPLPIRMGAGSVVGVTIEVER